MSALDYPGRSTARATDLRTIGDSFGTFVREEAPRAIFAGVAIATALRVLVGGFGWSDVGAVSYTHLTLPTTPYV